jgi:hypothetical protein
VVLLAGPLSCYRDPPADQVPGELALGAIHDSYESDGLSRTSRDPRTSTSEFVQVLPKGSHVVCAFDRSRDNYLELKRSSAAPTSARQSRSRRTAARVLDALSFDPVLAGEFPSGVAFEPGSEVAGQRTARPHRRLLAVIAAEPWQRFAGRCQGAAREDKARRHAPAGLTRGGA